MADRDSIQERGRSLELIEKIQRAAEADRARADLGRAAGLTDPALAQELLDLGFTAETVVLLPLVPILQMAWAEGGITKEERDLIVRFARSRGIGENSAADLRLTEWMTDRPSEAVSTPTIWSPTARRSRRRRAACSGSDASPRKSASCCPASPRI
jgi:hypothetical protein